MYNLFYTAAAKKKSVFFFLICAQSDQDFGSFNRDYKERVGKKNLKRNQNHHV